MAQGNEDELLGVGGNEPPADKDRKTIPGPVGPVAPAPAVMQPDEPPQPPASPSQPPAAVPVPKQLPAMPPPVPPVRQSGPAIGAPLPADPAMVAKLSAGVRERDARIAELNERLAQELGARAALERSVGEAALAGHREVPPPAARPKTGNDSLRVPQHPVPFIPGFNAVGHWIFGSALRTTVVVVILIAALVYKMFW